jgi:hypothetical protein
VPRACILGPIISGTHVEETNLIKISSFYLFILLFVGCLELGLGLRPDGVDNFLGSFIRNVGLESPYFRISEKYIYSSLSSNL